VNRPMQELAPKCDKRPHNPRQPCWLQHIVKLHTWGRGLALPAALQHLKPLA
jgi:hypothetical protein